MLDELGAWYRDLVAVAVGAEGAAIHVDHLDALQEDATPERSAPAETAAELVQETWRELQELQLQAPLAFEALFVQLRRAFAGSPVAVSELRRSSRCSPSPPAAAIRSRRTTSRTCPSPPR